MSVSLKGFNESVTTFTLEGTVLPGQVVSVKDNFTVKPSAANDIFAGVAVNAEKDYAGVQLTGYATVVYSGTAPTPGFCSLVADGNGGVKTSADGRQYLVTDVDSGAKTAGIILQ